MKTYTLYLPPEGQSDRDDSAIKFLQDGKSWFAIILPPVWLIWHRLWWGLAIYLVLAVIISLLVLTPWRDAAIFLSAIPGFYLFLEGHELVRQKYERKGWTYVGVVLANNIEEAQLRYYYSRNHSFPANSASSETIKPNRSGEFRPSQARPQPIGLFPLDERS